MGVPVFFYLQELISLHILQRCVITHFTLQSIHTLDTDIDTV